MESLLNDSIIELLKNYNHSLEPSYIIDKLNIEKTAIFSKIIRDLEKEGKIIITKKGNIALPEFNGLISAKIVSQAKKFAFAKPLNGGEEIYILAKNMKGALLGDTVILSKPNEGKNGLNSSVKRVIAKGDRIITGTISRYRSQIAVIPDCNFRFNINVEKSASLGARAGDKVKVEIFSNPRKNSKISARVLKIYGKSDSAKICSDAIIDSYNISTVFPDKVLSQAKLISNSKISDDDLKNRLDLRNENIFTIDGADAKDLDDAISIKQTDNGWILGVHIADVSHYVKEKSHIDKEAMARGTSVYFADRVIPMLPKEISNGVCSLNANEDKLTFSCFMDIDKKGKLKSFDFKKSIINSKVRGVYSEVNDIIMGNADKMLLNKYKSVLNSINLAKELSDLLKSNADKKGALNLETSEPYFFLNENGVCVDIKKRDRGESEEIIEQFMIMANQSAAIYAKSLELPFIYRIHESPDKDRIMILSKLAGALGLKNRRIKEGLTTSDLSSLLKEASKTTASGVISNQILRTMAKARYDYRPLGHFGLSLKDYCHFTSPIRRYPDLSIHRILSDFVNGLPIEKLQKKYKKFAMSSAKESSNNEIRAMRAERDAEKCYMAEYMTKHIGEEFDGIISGATQKGIFVELENSVEGFVSLDEFVNCRFNFDGLTGHTDEISGKKLIIGNPIRIKVLNANVANGLIDFTPA